MNTTSSRTSPEIDEEIDQINNAVIKVFKKIRDSNTNTNTNNNNNRVTDDRSYKINLRPYCELLYALSFNLSDAVQLGMRLLTVDERAIDKIIQSSTSRAYLMHTDIERIYQLEKEIDEQREQGNNKLADMLCKELEGLKKEGNVESF